jgi:ubiquinone/menaquinone biosynthesis C-methylase UbiE
MNLYSEYDAFAWLYNLEWAHFGNNIFPGLKIIAGKKLPDGAKILDLCCGTGQLARVLTEKGYSVTGIDGSEEMLRYARENAPEAEFIVSDARAFQLPPEYNAVLSTFDALNHVMTIEELGKVFKNVNKCLVSGGVFIFDMTTKYHFEIKAKDAKDIKEKPDYLFTIRSNYNYERKIGEWHFTIFQPQGKNWKRSDIKLYQTWYLCDDIKAALKKAGFSVIKAHSFNQERKLYEGTDDTDRVFFYTEKP